MKFNSIEFLLFFAVIFIILWRFKDKLKLANIVLLIASYVFYGWWDYRFLFLMFISSLVDYLVGYYIPKTEHKKLLMGISLVVNLGLLMFFKYFNFFIHASHDVLNSFGVYGEFNTLDIILPVGISFYTFQTLSYSLDIYKGKIRPEKNFIVFLNYVSFFPQLVAGPIERASSFLPQFTKKKTFDYDQAVLGMRLLLYGLFKKMVIADNVGLRVDMIFSDPSSKSAGTLVMGSFLFFVQLYVDFSAYTDIARGAAKLLGYNLMENFKTPLFSKNIPEFWSRWHISLTTWFRDYFFIWFAGLNKKSTLWRIFSTMVLFLIIGFWHGANYTFLAFGFFNGLYFIPKLLSRNNKPLRDALSYVNNHAVISKLLILGTVLLNSFTGVLFRSSTIENALVYYKSLFTNGSFSIDQYTMEIIPVCTVFLTYEWFMKDKKHPFNIEGFHPILRRAIYVCLIISTLVYGYFGKDPFYYFQF